MLRAAASPLATDRSHRMRVVQKPSQIVRALAFFLPRRLLLSLCKLKEQKNHKKKSLSG